MRNRSLIFAVAAALLWLSAPAPAEAGFFTLLKGAAKVGSAAAKGGRAATAAGKAGSAAAKGATLAKGATVVGKGASVLGAAVAAERVFANVALDARRVGLFVTREGDAAAPLFRVVTPEGDEAVYGAEAFQRYLGDLDELAKGVPDAGVDLYVDPSALDDVSWLVSRGADDVAEGASGTRRMFLADTDGASLPLRDGDLGVELAVADGVWVRSGDRGLSRLFDVAQTAFSAGDLWLVDPSCRDHVDRDTLVRSVAATPAGRPVVVVGEASPDDDVLIAAANEAGVDLVVLGLAGVCDPEGVVVDPIVARAAALVSQPGKLGDLWALAAGGEGVLVPADGLGVDLRLPLGRVVRGAPPLSLGALAVVGGVLLGMFMTAVGALVIVVKRASAPRVRPQGPGGALP